MRSYEEIGIGWQPKPIAVPAQQSVRSIVGVAHELVLTKGSAGWVVAKDSYVENLFLGQSPDATGNSWAISMGTTRNNSALKTESPLLSEASTTMSYAATETATAATHRYSWAKTVAYATKYWSRYNPAYPNYNPCGGDCADFVSQCLRQGGQLTDRTWYTYSGTGCIYHSANCGSTTWVNNSSLRSWIIRSGRGAAKASIAYLGNGDVSTYDWTGNGSFDTATDLAVQKDVPVSGHHDLPAVGGLQCLHLDQDGGQLGWSDHRWPGCPRWRYGRPAPGRGGGSAWFG